MFDEDEQDPFHALLAAGYKVRPTGHGPNVEDSEDVGEQTERADDVGSEDQPLTDDGRPTGEQTADKKWKDRAIRSLIKRDENEFVKCPLTLGRLQK